MGRCGIKVLPEATALRAGTLPSKDMEVGKKDTPVFLTMLPMASGEVLCVGGKRARMEFAINLKGEEILKATYMPETHTFSVDGKVIPLEASDEPSLHAYVDGSVIELIVSERIGYTKRFYYSDLTAPGNWRRRNRIGRDQVERVEDFADLKGPADYTGVQRFELNMG